MIETSKCSVLVTRVIPCRGIVKRDINYRKIVRKIVIKVIGIVRRDELI